MGQVKLSSKKNKEPVLDRRRSSRTAYQSGERRSHDRELPDMMSALEGGGGHRKAAVVREVA